MSYPTFCVWWKCADCGGQGWYPWQFSPDAPEPDQVQCNGCNGFGYIEVDDAPITPEALQREEWICIPEDKGVYERWLSSDEADTFVMVIIRGKEQCVSIVYGEMSHEYIDAPGVRTMPQLAALAEMLGGANDE